MTKHDALLQQNPNLSLAELAKKLHSNPSTISKITTIHKNLSNPAVSCALTLASAYAATRRKNTKTISEIGNSATEIWNSPEGVKGARSDPEEPQTEIETNIPKSNLDISP